MIIEGVVKFYSHRSECKQEKSFKLWLSKQAKTIRLILLNTMKDMRLHLFSFLFLPRIMMIDTLPFLYLKKYFWFLVIENERGIMDLSLTILMN